MSNEVKLEDAKPGMWAEFDIIENKKDIKTGHYLLELQSVPVKSVEDLMYLLLADALHGGRIIYSLGVDLDDGMIPIIDGEHEPMPYVDNLRVYEEKPESASSGTDASDDDTKGIPTEPGLYRAATGSVWYYDAKSWTPITDRDGNWTYSQKQSYKRFIETSLASHRCPFTPISLTGTEVNDPEDELPTEPGWYEDKEGAIYRFDGYFWKMLDISYITYGSDELRKYMPFKPIDDIELYVKKEIHGQA